VSSVRNWIVLLLQTPEVALDAGDDAGVAGDFGVPASRLGVVSERLDVDELGLELGQELGGGDEVVALLADVGIGAGLGGQMPGAVAVGDAGLEQLGSQPLDPTGDRWPVADEQRQGWRMRTLAIASW